jgi:FAD/FMN-containing dehydrogenase
MSSLSSDEKTEAALAEAVGRENLSRRDGIWFARPGAAGEVAELFRIAQASGLSVGTGTRAGALMIDTTRWVQVLHFDETSLLVHVQVGLTLAALEHLLETRGLTLGALPRRSLSRTIGGALAAPRPSEASPRGRLLDACAAVDAVLLDGTVVNTRLAPRRATGPDLSHALLGAHGATGLITAAWLRVARIAPSRAYRALHFSDGKSAIAAARALLDAGARPADLAIGNGAHLDDEAIDGGALLAVRCEGVPEVVDAESRLVVALSPTARELAPSIAEQWLAARGATRLRERFVPMSQLAAAWSDATVEIGAFRPAGAVLFDEGAPLSPKEPLAALTAALAARLAPARSRP